jgi:hypothetical protein
LIRGTLDLAIARQWKVQRCQEIESVKIESRLAIALHLIASAFSTARNAAIGRMRNLAAVHKIR